MALDDSDKAWIKETLEGMETRLLTEFHKWATTYESRSRGIAALVREFEVRLEAAEDRISALEHNK